MSIITAVGDTDLECRLLVKYVQFGHGPEVNAVHHGGIACNNGIIPTATTRTSSRGTEFATFLPKMFAGGIRQFGRKRSTTDTRGVTLDHTHDAIDPAWRETRACAGAACRRIGGCHEGVGSEVDIQHCSLCAFEQNAFASAIRGVDKDNRICNIGLQNVGQFGIVTQQGVDIQQISAPFGETEICGDTHLADAIEKVRTQKITDAKATASHFGAVGRANTAPRGSDLLIV